VSGRRARAHRSIGGIDIAAQRLAAQSIGEFRTFRTSFNALNRFA